jgi:nitronate monooxygenase
VTSFFIDRGAKASCDIWGLSQNVRMMNDVPTIAEVIARIKQNYVSTRT